MPDPDAASKEDKTVNRNMYDEYQWQRPLGPVLSWKQPDYTEILARLSNLEDAVARIEDTVNRMSIALGCDDKSRVLVVKDYVGALTHDR